VICELTNTYEQLFQWQRKTYDHMEFQQALKVIHITKYMTKVIYEKHLIFTNRKKKQWKRFNWNHMYGTKTTWKYPPAFHDGKGIIIMFQTWTGRCL
jgi:hypothetical protein